MRVRLNAITSTPSGFRCGVQIHGPKDSWVRFGILEIPFESVTEECWHDWWKWNDRDERDVDLDAPLPMDWG